MAIESKTVIPADQITVKIQEKNFDIGTPNSGQLIDIETAKLRYSKNMHSSLLFSQSRQSIYVYTLIDALSTMSVLIPTLAKTLEVDNLANLNVVKMKVLVDVYIKEIEPWMNTIQDFLNGVEKQILDGDQGTGDIVESQI